jgi:Predicted signal transduction protein with a C-terminal ATPase domain
MIVYAITLYISASVIIKDIIKESLEQTLNKATNSIDSFIDSNEKLSLSISKDNIIQSYLVENYTKKTDITLDDVIAVDKAIKKYPSADKSILRIELYDSNKRMIYSSADYTMGDSVNSKYEKILENSYGNTVWSYIDVDTNGKNVLSIFRKIYGINSDKYSLKTIGYLRITLYGLKSLYENISYESSNFYILDKDGNYISNKFDYLIGEPSDYIFKNKSLSYRNHDVEILNKNLIEVIYSNCTKVPWMLVGEIKSKDILKENGQIISSSLYLVFSMCILIFILSYIISLSFSKSFDSMSKKLVRFSNGDLNVDFTSIYYFNEIDMLSKTFNKMADRINELTETLFYEQLKAEELEREKKESELIALQAQINPHFLYNTFESIKWMMDYNAQNAAVMLTQLGDLFRLGINRKSQFITLEEEIKYAKTYVDIQKVRYGDNIKVSWIVDNNIIKYMVPKLILQPLIENVFIHGFKAKKENGSIDIYCIIEDDNIVFKIIDNGEGIKKDMLEEINNKLKGVLLGESVGIYNVQKRIRLYYGERSEITLLSQVGVGTIAKLSIPIPSEC